MVAFTKVYVERIFYFFCFRGWSKGACFLHLLREDYRSLLKVESFLPKGVSFYPSISPFTMKECEGYACKNPLTNERSPPSQIEHTDTDRRIVDISCRPERTGTGTVRHHHGADEGCRWCDRGIEAYPSNGMGAALQ